MDVLGYTLLHAEMMERDGDVERLFVSLKIAAKINTNMSPINNQPKETFDMWEATDEQMQNQWDIYANLRQKFKNDRNEFQKSIEEYNFFDVHATAQFSSLYFTLSDLKQHFKSYNPENHDKEYNFYEDFTSTLIRRAYALKGRFG